MKSNQNIRVVTSCRGRFLIFDQARELNKHGMLYQLITDYPKNFPQKFGVPPEKVKALLLTGIFNHGFNRIRKYVPKNWLVHIDHFIHSFFSRRLPKLIPKETEFFIGLSSFCLEGILYCKSKGIPCAVEHASIHQADERNLQMEEARYWGVDLPTYTTPPWVIEKEQKEFLAADYVFVPSHAAKESMVRNGIPAEKIFVNHYGVEVSSFSPHPKKDSVFRVIQVGNINLGKGVLHLIEAFKKANIPNSELWFVGPGLESFGLKDKIEQLKTNNIHFIGQVPQKKLPELFSQASISVLCSLADGFGLVVPQSMACGIPVIVTENVGAKDIIRPGENGFIVPIRDQEALVEKLKYIAANPEILVQMRQHALNTASKQFSWEQYGNRIAKFIKETVK